MDALLLERESQLATLAEYAQEARQGSGRLVLIAGEAGVGKSALVERLQQDLPDARWSPKSITFGSGTPSCVATRMFEGLMSR